MTSAAESPLGRDVAGALDWWRLAGVDHAFSDEAEPWLRDEPEETAAASAGPASTKPRAEPPPHPAIGGDRAGWPATLDQFAPWWLGEPTLAPGEGRVPPRGMAGAQLLVLVEQPEAADRDVLLSGADGTLAAAFLRAAGIDAERTYFASVLPRHMPHPDWSALRSAGLDAVVLHHLALARPARVIAFGEHILPLLGHDPAKSPEILLKLNQEGLQVPVLAARGLDALRARPAWKAGLWRRWLDWTG